MTEAYRTLRVTLADPAPDPEHVAKRVLVGFPQRKDPRPFAWLTSTITACPFGTPVFAGDYIALPVPGSPSRSRNTTPRPWPGISAPTWPTARAPEPRPGCWPSP